MSVFHISLESKYGSSRMFLASAAHNVFMSYTQVYQKSIKILLTLNLCIYKMLSALE